MGKHTWKNWAETAICHPEQVRRPKSEADIVAAIAEAKATGKRLRVAGNGHSFSQLVATDYVLVALDNWQGILKVDGNLATVRSGTNIKTLGESLHERGLAQENLGDIDVQSIAGALSTGTHGTGTAFGTLSTQIAELTFINAKGERITCSETQHHDIFKAAQVSLGALGVITEYKLRCSPKYVLELKTQKAGFNECLSQIERYNRENRNFEFYYFPYTETVQMKISNLTDKPPQNAGFMQYLNDIVLENGLFKCFSEISRRIPSQSRNVSRLVGRFAGESRRNTWSHRVYSTSRWVKFTEMEYNIPSGYFEECVREVKKKIEDTRYDLHFPIECRFVKADDIWMSPAYQRESAYIAVHMYKGMPYKRYFKDMEAIFKKYHGRPHWGKLHYQTPDSLWESYPKWEDFHAIRREMDPEGLFMNEYLEWIFGKDTTGCKRISTH